MKQEANRIDLDSFNGNADFIGRVWRPITELGV